MIKLIFTVTTIMITSLGIAQNEKDTPFAVWLKCNNKPVNNIKVNFISSSDTVTITTDKKGFAITSIDKSKDLPFIIINNERYEYFKFKVTKQYLDTTAILYNNFELIKID